MAESRQELINWVNDVLLLNITKVEQCGTGAVFCQLFDSIYMDLPMSKVRFDASTEYQYLNNFKILQSTFTKYQLDRAIPVEKLVKCRFQDNLEFLQWTRKHWDAYFPGHEYDPESRRRTPVGGKLLPPGSARQPASYGGAGGRSASSSITAPRTTTRPTAAPAAARRTPSASRPPSVQRGGASGAPAASSAALNAAKEKVKELTDENEQLVGAVDLVESERDFYFQKLRDIEVLIQSAADQLDGDGTNNANGEEQENELDEGMDKLDLNSKNAHSQLIREIQTILYSTTEGFEIPTQEFETEETF